MPLQGSATSTENRAPARRLARGSGADKIAVPLLIHATPNRFRTNIIGAEPDPVDKKTEDHDAESGPGSCEICVWKVLSLKPNHSRDSEGNQITMLPVLALPKHVGKMEHRDHVGAVAIGIGIPGIQKPERNQGACARNENFSRVFAGGVGRCHWRLKGLDSRDCGT